MVTLTDEVGRRQKGYSDVIGRYLKTEVLNWNGSVYLTTTNTYNARDQITRVRQYVGATPSPEPDGEGTGYQTSTMYYEGFGRLKTRHSPIQQVDSNNSASTDHTTWDYYADDTVQKVTDARGAVSTFSYNGRRMVTNISYSLLPGAPTTGPSAIASAASASFTYDAAGNRISMTDGTGNTTYNYDQQSRMASENRYFNELGHGYALSYGYNLADNVTSVTDAYAGQVTYTRNEVGQISNINGSGTAFSTYASAFGYRAWGALRHIKYGNNVTADSTYNLRLQIASYTVSGANPAHGPAVVMNGEFGYYADARLKNAKDLNDSNFDRSVVWDLSFRGLRSQVESKCPERSWLLRGLGVLPHLR